MMIGIEIVKPNEAADQLGCFPGSHQRKGAVKGSGLGLSIARDCIRRMHGELNLVTDDRTDVCFRIELPLKPEKSMK
jgi:two-component system sensor histidine kinase GlrK